LAASPEPADRPLGQGGLGLRLTRMFAAEVGWYITDETKRVWASFPG
jgi:serine/threonine-protein kinase RsbW